jgi:hypothetical protein
MSRAADATWHNPGRMFSFLQRDLPAVGCVFYRGPLAPRLENLSTLSDPVACRALTATPDQIWAVEATHPVWGSAEIACDRRATPIADVVIDQTTSLSDSEKTQARLAQTAITIRVRTSQGRVLRDRKRLLFWLQTLMHADGVVAADVLSKLLWSRAMLDDELAHEADLDIESLYAIHAIHDASDPPRTYWLHTHGLEELGAFDVDILEPSPTMAANCGDPIRALAYAAMEGTVSPDTDRFQVAHPRGEIRFVPADRFQSEASSGHQRLRDLETEHRGRRAVVCEPAGGLFGRWRTRPVPSRFFSRFEDGAVLHFSTAASELMSERARQTVPVFQRLKDEFESLKLPTVMKLGYEVDGDGPTNREHLWFEVHRVWDDRVDATLANAPHRISRMAPGQRGEHSLERLTDWMILSPEGPMTPRNISAARRLRETRSKWQAEVDAAAQ